MKAVIQRVKQASVKVDGKIVGEIQAGLLVFLGVAKTDTDDDMDWMVKKLVDLRVFEDVNGKMNISALDVNAEFLVVSQFTILGSCLKGRRPSFNEAADPQKGKAYYEAFIARLKSKGVSVETGIFQAMMDVSLINDGPVTFVIDSPQKEAS